MNNNETIKHLKDLDKIDREGLFLQAGSMLEAITQFAKLAIYSSILVNGMSIITILAFWGDALENKTIIDISMLKWSMGFFSLGVFLGLFASFSAFYSQFNFREAMIGAPKDKSKKEVLAVCYRKAGVILLILSFLLFIIGAFFAISSFRPC